MDLIGPKTLELNPDAFSDGQIASKLWLCEKLEDIAASRFEAPVIWIYGGWYGMLAFLLLARKRLDVRLIRSFDIDPSVERLARQVNGHWAIQGRKFKASTMDVNLIDFADPEFGSKYGPAPDIVVNTATEHFREITWWSRIPPGKLVAVQGTDMDVHDHVNRVFNLDEMKSRFNEFGELLFSGELQFHYKDLSFRRFMLMGTK